MTTVTTIADYPAAAVDAGACPECHNGHVYRYESWAARYPYRYEDPKSGRTLLGYLRVVRAIPNPAPCWFCGVSA